MGMLRRDVTLIGPKGRRRVQALFDSGSSHTLVREEIALAIARPMEIPEPKKFEAAVGTFHAREAICADIMLDRKRLYTMLTVVPALTEDAIIGTDFLQRWHVRLDFRRHRIKLDPKALRLKCLSQ